MPWLGPGGRKLNPGGRGPGNPPVNIMDSWKTSLPLSYPDLQGWEGMRGLALQAAQKRGVSEGRQGAC